MVFLNRDCDGDGFSFEELRGGDAAVAEVLLAAAEKSGCEIYTAAADICEPAAPEYDMFGEPTVNEDAFSEKNLLDRRYDLLKLTPPAPAGAEAKFTGASFRKSDILPADSLCEFEPYDEGPEDEWADTYDRLYRLSAISLWPGENSSSK